MVDAPDTRLAQAERATVILHVAADLWEYLRDKYGATDNHPAIAGLPGHPVVLEDALQGGQWEIREDGQVIKSGDVAPAPEGMVAFYAGASFGWLAVDPRIRRPFFPEDLS
jgi:hypothetical protein